MARGGRLQSDGEYKYGLRGRTVERPFAVKVVELDRIRSY